MNPTTSETTETKASAAEHAKAIAELRKHDSIGLSEEIPGRYYCWACDGYFDSIEPAEPCGKKIHDALDYAETLASDRDRLAKELEQERAKLQAAERVAQACVDWQNDDGSCHFCGFGVNLGPPIRDIPHDNECPLVENGFINRDGSRAGGAGGKTT